MGGFSERLKCLVDFSVFWSKQNTKPQKQDRMQTYILLTIDNSVRKLSLIHIYFYLIKIDTMVIIMNKLHYICKYEWLKYELFIDSSLTATRY